MEAPVYGNGGDCIGVIIDIDGEVLFEADETLLSEDDIRRILEAFEGWSI